MGILTRQYVQLLGMIVKSCTLLYCSVVIGGTCTLSIKLMLKQQEATRYSMTQAYNLELHIIILIQTPCDIIVPNVFPLLYQMDS